MNRNGLILLVAIAAFVMRILNGQIGKEKTMDPTVEPDESQWKTGYQISFNDFRRLVAEPEALPPLEKKMREWFGYSASRQGGETILRDQQGLVVDLKSLHVQIQMDPERQRSIYGQGMDIWR